MPRKQRWLTAWVPHRLEMLISPSWQTAPRPLRRALERIEIEHLRHGGLNNGHLYVSYSQFIGCGISRRRVRDVLTLGEKLGLLEAIQDEATVRGDIRPPNRYRLTYVPAKNASVPTDEWRSVTKERAERYVEAFKTADNVAKKDGRRAAA